MVFTNGIGSFNVKAKSISIAVEGNIGSGKTTLLHHMSKKLKCSVICEPVNEWRDLDNQNLLKKLYSNPKRWCTTFQTKVMLDMARIHRSACEPGINFLERTIYSAKHCFVDVMYDLS
ncbi:hypothetical protein ACOME3_006672 [Neoechinorhynchus agilis]